MAFIKKSFFKSQVSLQKEEDRIVAWTEIISDQVFKIVDLVGINAQFGLCFIIAAEDESEVNFKLFFIIPSKNKPTLEKEKKSI